MKYPINQAITKENEKTVLISKSPLRGDLGHIFCKNMLALKLYSSI